MLDLLLMFIGILAGFILFYNIPIIDTLKFAELKKGEPVLKISIIIPCRNEEKNIGELLDALSKQNYPIHEIICVDDLSEDKTANIIRSKKAILKSITSHPEGWIGKTFAVQTGAEAASGNVLLFLDADLKLEPNAIATLIASYKENGTISVQPYHKMKKPYEQLALFFNLTAVANTGIALPVPKQKGLFGPVIMIDKDVYFKAGGHNPVKSCVVEDYTLGIYYKKTGVPYKLMVGNKDIVYRMYPNSLKEQFEGFTKNFSIGILSSGLLTTILTFFWITAVISTPINIVKFALSGYAYGTGISIAILFVILMQIGFYSRQIGNFKLYLLPLYPLAAIWFCIVIIYSFIRKIFFHTAKWKNRKVKI